jgi:hypothetical protein
MSQEGVKLYPLASDRRERVKRSLVCTSSPAALPAERGVSAHRGGWVRTEAFLSILRLL